MAAFDDRQLHELGVNLNDWLVDERKRAEAAEKQNRDLVQVHREGWKQTADAIYKGLGLIAEAIRRS